MKELPENLGLFNGETVLFFVVAAILARDTKRAQCSAQPLVQVLAEILTENSVNPDEVDLLQDYDLKSADGQARLRRLCQEMLTLMDL